MFELLQCWGFRFFKDYVELEQRVMVIEAENQMQWQTIKGLVAEIEMLKK